MSWVEVKKALNSTLGTSEFKPLDEMLEEIKNNYHIVSSSEKIGELGTEYTVRYDGRIRISVNLYNSKSWSEDFSVTIIVDGNQKKEHLASVTPNSTKWYSLDIVVKKGTKIKITAQDLAFIFVKDAELCGSVVAGDVPLTPSPLE